MLDENITELINCEHIIFFPVRENLDLTLLLLGSRMMLVQKTCEIGLDFDGTNTDKVLRKLEKEYIVDLLIGNWLSTTYLSNQN